MQAKKLKIIKVPLEGRLKLAEKYKCRRETIYNALGNRTHSELAERIRNDALKLFGGVVCEKVVFH